MLFCAAIIPSTVLFVLNMASREVCPSFSPAGDRRVAAALSWLRVPRTDRAPARAMCHPAALAVLALFLAVGVACAAQAAVKMQCSPSRDGDGFYRDDLTALFVINIESRKVMQAPRAGFDRRIELRVFPQQLVLDFYYGKYAPDPAERGRIYEKLVIDRRSGNFESHDYVANVQAYPGKRVGDLSGESRKGHCQFVD